MVNFFKNLNMYVKKTVNTQAVCYFNHFKIPNCVVKDNIVFQVDTCRPSSHFLFATISNTYVIDLSFSNRVRNRKVTVHKVQKVFPARVHFCFIHERLKSYVGEQGGPAVFCYLVRNVIVTFSDPQTPETFL